MKTMMWPRLLSESKRFSISATRSSGSGRVRAGQLPRTRASFRRYLECIAPHLFAGGAAQPPPGSGEERSWGRLQEAEPCPEYSLDWRRVARPFGGAAAQDAAWSPAHLALDWRTGTGGCRNTSRLSPAKDISLHGSAPFPSKKGAQASTTSCGRQSRRFHSLGNNYFLLSVPIQF